MVKICLRTKYFILFWFVYRSTTHISKFAWVKVEFNKRYTSQRSTTLLKLHRGENKNLSNILNHYCPAKHKYQKARKKAGRRKKRKTENLSVLTRIGGVKIFLTIRMPGPVIRGWSRSCSVCQTGKWRVRRFVGEYRSSD